MQSSGFSGTVRQRCGDCACGNRGGEEIATSNWAHEDLQWLLSYCLSALKWGKPAQNRLPEW
jgi:hypothetical protein